MGGWSRTWAGRARSVAFAALIAWLGAGTQPALARLYAAQIDPEPAAAGPAPASREPSPQPDDERSALYDPSNGDLDRLQAPREAMRGLPRDRDGKVDWMKAVRERGITPRATRADAAAAGEHAVIDLDIIMRNTKEMPYVRFPHRAHTEWLACSNCHPALFEPKAGSTRIKMEDIFRGRFCGTCHDRVAFVTHRNCERCHSVPQPGAPRH